MKKAIALTLALLFSSGCFGSYKYHSFSHFPDRTLINEYKAYEFKPSGDMKDKHKEFVVPLNDDSPKISSIAVKDVKLTFFPEILEILENVSLSIPESSQVCLQSMPSCKFQSKACLMIRYPELYVKEQKTDHFDPSELSNLEGLIKIPGGLFYHLDFQFPPSIINEEFMKKLRTIIIKICFSTLMQEINSELEHYSQLLENQQISSTNDNIKDLWQELIQARDYLTALDQSGRMQAEKDRQVILASGRCRDPLPIPSLTDEERQLLSLYLGGIYWRMRGGGLWKTGSTYKTRYYFTYMPMTQIGKLNGLKPGEEAGEAIYNRVSKGWGEYMDMGTSQGDKYTDLIGMTERGWFQIGKSTGMDSFLYNSATRTLNSYGFDTTALEIGGLQMGPCYFYSWEKLGHLKIGHNLPPHLLTFIGSETNWAELCTGAAISLGLSKTLLKGYSCPRSLLR